MKALAIALTFFVLLSSSPGYAQFPCRPGEPQCPLPEPNVGGPRPAPVPLPPPAPATISPPSPATAPAAPPAAEKPAATTGAPPPPTTARPPVNSLSPAKVAADGPRRLLPVRAYLAAKDIPPAKVGAYGLVVLHSKPTQASKAKLMMVCKSFLAFFPRAATAPVAIEDQMITIWPVDDPTSEKAKNDDCDFVLDRYDLVAAQMAMADARKQKASFEGSGPYLVGWSPSKSRGLPDALVLVVDMSADNNQADIDNKFRFWKTKIIENPAAWRDGWSVEAVRAAIHNFADQYGQAIVDAVKLVRDSKP